jgi:hypothetical protein
MARGRFGKEKNSKKFQPPLDDATTIDRSCGYGEARSTIERMNKMRKILALVNSPHEGEALTAARMVMKLSRAWGIDLGHLRGPTEELVENLLEKVVQSGHGRFSASQAVPTNQVHECSDLENPRRPTPSYVRAPVRRRRGGPPFPVRSHRRWRRARRPSTTRGSGA